MIKRRTTYEDVTTTMEIM